MVGALHESLRLFHLCENMQWNHLPVAGGIYDQHPKFIADLELLFEAKNAAEAKRQKEQERKMEMERRRNMMNRRR